LPPIIVSRGRGARLRGYARRAASSKGVKVTGALVAGGLYGYLEGTGKLDKIPTFGGMPPSVTIAAAAWLGSKAIKHPMAKAAAFAAIAIAAFDVGKSMAKK
jgi:hypothetical protein